MLKRVVYLSLIVLTLCAVWYGRGYFFDEPPDVGRDTFYAGSDRHISDESNVAIAISGLSAPIGIDTIKYGRVMINDLNEDQKQAAKSDNQPNETQYIYLDKQNEIDCSSAGAIEIDFERCTTAEHIKELLNVNKLLLDRYFALYKIIDWQGTTTKASNFLSVNRLLSAQIKLLVSEGDYEKAYQLWKDNHLFISRIIGQEGTLIDRAIVLVADGLNLSSLENLIYKNPEIASIHYDELTDLLRPQGLARYNIKGLMRGEFVFLNNVFIRKNETNKFIQLEYFRNRLYRFHREFIYKAELPANTITENQKQLADKYQYSGLLTIAKIILPHGLSDILVNLLISGSSKGLALVTGMHSKSAFINLLNLSVNIRQQKIASAHIQDYLNTAGSQFNCPFTQKPMVYDSTKQSIYCENPETQERVAEIRL